KKLPTLVITRSNRDEDRIIRCFASKGRPKTSGMENCDQVMLILVPECATCWQLVLPSFPLGSSWLSFAPTRVSTITRPSLGWRKKRSLCDCGQVASGSQATTDRIALPSLSGQCIDRSVFLLPLRPEKTLPLRNDPKTTSRRTKRAADALQS